MCIDINFDNQNVRNRLCKFGKVACKYGRSIDWLAFLAEHIVDYGKYDENYLNQEVAKRIFPQLNLNWVRNGKLGMLLPHNDNRLQFLFGFDCYS